ncbi:MAG: cupin domain-containing protein [Pseudomonadota bacterium]
MDAGVTVEQAGLDGIVWNILGQTYVPKLHSENAMMWHAILPADTFVPPHIHNTQDEWIHVLSGNLEVDFESGTREAGPGDLVRMPMGIWHGVFNRSGAEATAMFGVAPTRGLFDLFSKIHNVPDPGEVVRLAAEHEIDFLPPPAS